MVTPNYFVLLTMSTICSGCVRLFRISTRAQTERTRISDFLPMRPWQRPGRARGKLYTGGPRTAVAADLQQKRHRLKLCPRINRGNLYISKMACVADSERGARWASTPPTARASVAPPQAKRLHSRLRRHCGSDHRQP